MSGVGFLFNNKTINIENVEVVVDGSTLLIDVEKNGSKFRIINVYGHTDTKERTALFQTLQPFLCNRRQIIMGGDFNCTPETNARQGASSRVKKDSSTCALEILINDGNLKDVFRSLNPTDPGHTWSNKKTASRIDFLFASKGLTPLSCKVEPVAFSDHHNVTCRFDSNLHVDSNPLSTVSGAMEIKPEFIKGREGGGKM
uniref:Endonuclease/exonuclease/phosphatase domain-containing protein n=1 Tax=Neolamprologus brichardi TaxID=32507 RepID=A0A3Q4HKI9_NEOBR